MIATRRQGEVFVMRRCALWGSGANRDAGTATDRRLVVRAQELCGVCIVRISALAHIAFAAPRGEPAVFISANTQSNHVRQRRLSIRCAQANEEGNRQRDLVFHYSLLHIAALLAHLILNHSTFVKVILRPCANKERRHLQHPQPQHRQARKAGPRRLASLRAEAYDQRRGTRLSRMGKEQAENGGESATVRCDEARRCGGQG